MEAIGRRWYLVVLNVGLPVDGHVILSMWVGRYLLRPEVQAVSCCQDLWSQLSSSEMDDLHSLSSAAFSFLAWSSRTSWSAWMSGLDFPVRGISL